MTGAASEPAVDGVLVTFNNAATIGACLRSARAAGVDGRLIVVDHGADGTGDVAEAAGATVLRDPSNPGFGAGQNHGRELARAPYLLILNPDATMVADSIAVGKALLDREPDVAAVQGAIHNASSGEPERSQGQELGPAHLVGRLVGARRLRRIAAARTIARRTGFTDHVARIPPRATDVASLAATALLVRRRALEDIGGFDESIFLYGEDLDLCRRLRRRGWRLVALPQDWAVHVSGGSSGSTWDRELAWWSGTLVFAAKWWSPASWVAALATAAVRAVALIIRRPSRGLVPFRQLVGEPWTVRRSTACARGRPSPTERCPRRP